MNYIGFDLHKKTISICAKQADGNVVRQWKIHSTRADVQRWAAEQQRPWIGVMESTLFTGWVYDMLKPWAQELKVADPVMVKAISASKKKNDTVDSATLADLVRCNLVPECYQMPGPERQLRSLLRYRFKLLRETVRFKNTIAGLLMAEGCVYEKKKLHRQAYFSDLLEQLTEVPDSTREMLQLSRSFMTLFNRTQQQLLKQLERHPQLCARVALLQSVPGIGQVTSLTWAVETGHHQRFSSIRKAWSYCGLTSAEQSSSEKHYRGPLSKRRNSHLQSVLIEAAKLAPQHNETLKQLYEKECTRGHRNRATIAVARKLVAYLVAVDKSGRPFSPPPAAAPPCVEHT